ncbi:hypothetical protein HZS_1621, partial [Henneguya salminicola]
LFFSILFLTCRSKTIEFNYETVFCNIIELIGQYRAITQPLALLISNINFLRKAEILTDEFDALIRLLYAFEKRECDDKFRSELRTHYKSDCIDNTGNRALPGIIAKYFELDWNLYEQYPKEGEVLFKLFYNWLKIQETHIKKEYAIRYQNDDMKEIVDHILLIHDYFIKLFSIGHTTDEENILPTICNYFKEIK